MRIVAGEKRGIRLEALEGMETRPTLERVKEAVFSSVQFILPGARVLDLYSGSGQLGLEALSRGASSCVFIDMNKDAVDLIIRNAKKSGLFSKSKIARMEAEAFLSATAERFDIVFIDPPFDKAVFPEIFKSLEKRLNPGAVVICESADKGEFPETAGKLSLAKKYKYGSVFVHRYVMADESI